jgi:endoglucanase
MCQRALVARFGGDMDDAGGLPYRHRIEPGQARMRMRAARLLAVKVGLGMLPAAANAAEAYLRVNEIGYEAGAPARVYLMARGTEAGAPYRITNAGGQIAAAGHVGAASGKWGGFTVYPIDFSLGATGRYTITVSGALPAVSPAFPVAPPGNLYGALIANTLAFYRAERDGPDFVAGPLRTAAAHLNDGNAAVYETPPVANDLILAPLVATGATIDARGGWWDAGDYLKFVETHSYTVGMLLTGLRDFPKQMGPGSASDFTAETQFGVGWLLRMWNDNTSTLYYQTGNGIDFKGKSIVSDHDIWRLPQTDDTYGGSNPDDVYIRHRPVFAAGPAGSRISPNLAGRLAASFALCFQDFAASDTHLAQSCLLAAVHIFDLADTRPKQLLTTLPYDFYPETEWRDDLEWGAAELYFALSNGGANLPPNLPHDAAYYLSQSAAWAYAYIHGPNDGADTLNLYDVSGLAHVELIRAIAAAGFPPGLKLGTADLLADLASQLGGAVMQGKKDPFGFGFPWDSYDTTSHGAGLSVMASEYAWLTGGAPWIAASQRWMANILGANAWGISLVVGDGGNFTKCLQHQVANIKGSLTGGSLVLLGAAVEGPNATTAIATGSLPGMRACPANNADPYRQFTEDGARFQDNVQNYANTEPAIDLAAALPLMFAWRAAGAPRK